MLRQGGSQAADRDPRVVFQPPPIFGFRHQLPPPLPEFESPHEVAENIRRGQESLRGLDSRIATVAANARGRSWEVPPELAWGAVAVMVVSFFGMGAGGIVPGISFIVFIAAFACVWYSWPYLTGVKSRSDLARLESDRAAVARSVQESERWLADRRAEHERKRQNLLVNTPTFFGVGVPPGSGRVEVFGGNKIEWEAMLTTAGGSLLAAGNHLVVLDFSERLVSTCLAHLAAHTGYSVTQVFLPEQAGALDVFGGLDGETIVEVVVQAWSGGELQRADRVDMNRDRYVLDRIRACLKGRVTLARLAEAVDVVLQQTANTTKGSKLSLAEQTCLIDSFGTSVRGGMQFTDRLMPMTSYLQSLGPLGSGKAQFRLGHVGDNDLSVVALTSGGDILDKAALMELLVQALQRHFTSPKARGQAQPSHIVIVGADLLSNSALERLHRFSDEVGVGVIMFRARFDETAEKLAGSGDSTQLFMRLGNRKDAERAADHVGRKRYFVLSSVSANETDTVTDTYGEALGTSDGMSLGMMAVNLGQMPLLIPNITRTTGSSKTTNWGKSTGKSTGTTGTASRVHELFVEPETIQTLPPYTFLWKERGDLPLIAGDCDIELAYSPKVARQLSR